MTLVLVAVPESGTPALSRALESGFSDILFESRTPPEPLLRLGRIQAYSLDGENVLLGGRIVGSRIEIRNRDDEERARERARRDEIVIVRATDWKIIPLENLVAAFQGSRAKLLAEVRTAEEAAIFLDTLESGVQGILLRAESIEEIGKFRTLLDHRTVPPVRLEEATVTAIRPSGVGDRVCIDSCSILAVGEGMLVGSSASALFLVASEAQESEYVAARPFRVNAGPVHAYVLCPRGKTKYLCELKAGDEVLAVTSKGEARIVIVGRSKLERRPLVVLTAKMGAREIATVLQNAETIRLSTPSGPRSVVEIAPGDRVLVRTEEGGRHFGMAVRETVMER